MFGRATITLGIGPHSSLNYLRTHYFHVVIHVYQFTLYWQKSCITLNESCMLQYLETLDEAVYTCSCCTFILQYANNRIQNVLHILLSGVCTYPQRICSRMGGRRGPGKDPADPDSPGKRPLNGSSSSKQGRLSLSTDGATEL